MTEAKTKPTTVSVVAFLDLLADDQKRQDSLKLIELMEKVTGKKATMWGPTIIGFDSYHYKYESGHEGDAPKISFSPRKQNISVYIMPGLDKYPQLLEKLGKYKLAKACLYIKKLSDVDKSVLTDLITKSYQEMKTRYS